MHKKYFKQETFFSGTIFWFEENGLRVQFGEVPGNRHYEEYIAWLAEGNEPEVVE